MPLRKPSCERLGTLLRIGPDSNGCICSVATLQEGRIDHVLKIAHVELTEAWIISSRVGMYWPQIGRKGVGRTPRPLMTNDQKMSPLGSRGRTVGAFNLSDLKNPRGDGRVSRQRVARSNAWIRTSRVRAGSMIASIQSRAAA